MSTALRLQTGHFLRRATHAQHLTCSLGKKDSIFFSSPVLQLRCFTGLYPRMNCNDTTSPPQEQTLWHPSTDIMFLKEDDSVDARLTCQTQTTNLMSVSSDQVEDAAKINYRKTWNPDDGIRFGQVAQAREPKLAPQTDHIASQELELERHINLSSDAISLSADIGQLRIDSASGAESNETLSLETRMKYASLAETCDAVSVEAEFKVAYSLLKASTREESSHQYWTYSLYRDKFDRCPQLHYCTHKTVSERVAQFFLSDKILGFDLEWKPNTWSRSQEFRDNVSLIQIANEERIALFHIAMHTEEHAEDVVAPTLRKILESVEVAKVGVAIQADCTRLGRTFGFQPKGLFELSHLYKLIRYCQGKTETLNRRLVSLAIQAQEHLCLPLAKDSEVRSSDWSKRARLSNKQCEYAASDAYACFQLFKIMNSIRQRLTPTPPLPFYAEEGLPIRTSIIDSDEDFSADSSRAYRPNQSGRGAAGAHGGNATYTDVDETLTSKTSSRLAGRILKSTSDGRAPSTLHTSEYDDGTLLESANTWAVQHRRSSSKTTASPACLRAYFLWHHQHLELDQISELLRNPPLQRSTVSRYILDCILLEDLAFEECRVDALLDHLPGTFARHRYSSIQRSSSEVGTCQ